MFNNQITQEKPVVFVTRPACPDAFFSDIWDKITNGDIDYTFELWGEIGQEFSQIGDLRLLVKIAIHDGFVRGVDHCRDALGSEGTSPPILKPAEKSACSDMAKNGEKAQ